jgi:putative membrane protein
MIGFSVSNSQPVNLNFYFTVLSLPLSLTLACAIIFGCLIGFLCCLKSIISSKYQARNLRKQISVANKEIANLRSIPIKDGR